MPSDDEDEEMSEDQDIDETVDDNGKEDSEESIPKTMPIKPSKQTKIISQKQRKSAETAIAHPSTILSSSADSPEEPEMAELQDEEDEDEIPVIIPTKKRTFDEAENNDDEIENDEDDEEEDVLEINLDEEGSDEEEENIPPVHVSSNEPTKKRRLGLGRPTVSSDRKVFNLTSRPAEGNH